MTDFRDERLQILQDDRDHWKRRAETAETELRRWYGVVNSTRPDLKPSIMRRLASIFHVVRAKR